MRLIYRIANWIDSAKWFLQRMFRGYSDIDIWNLDNYIEKSVLPKLKIFRENTQAYPSIPGECESFEEWQAILDDMIFGIEFGLNDDDWYIEHVLYKKGEDKEKALELFNRMQSRAQRGRELFGKWLTALWW